MQKPISFRAMSVPFLGVGLSLGCTPQASKPVERNDSNTPSPAAPEADGSGAKSPPPSTGSGNK